MANLSTAGAAVRRTCSVRTRNREFSWSILLAPVAFPILGADFLSRVQAPGQHQQQAAGGTWRQAHPAGARQAYQGSCGDRSGGSTHTAGGGSLSSFTSHSEGTQQQLLSAASGHPARQGGQKAQGGGNGPAAGGPHLYTFTSHRGGTQHRQWLIRAAGSQPARRGSHDASYEV